MGDKMDRSRKLPDLPYFYGAGAEQFAFYRIPKAFFTEAALCEISLEAKLLYGLMLDRLALSARNGWVDEENRVFIYYTVDSIMEDLNCGNKKAVKLLNELDSEYGLIERKRQGQGKPTRIYVKNFSTLLQNRHFQKCQNDTSKSVKTTSLDMSERHSNKTNINNTEFNKINPIYPPESDDGYDGLDEYKQYRDYFLDQLEFNVLLANHPYDGEVLNEILELLVETVCSKRQYLHVCGEDKPAEVVKSRLMKLTSDHIEYVLDCLKSNTTAIKNIKRYLLATLYNAPVTISSYYSALVNHDLYGRKEE